ncbi:cytochrome P450 4C1-like [Bombus vosnesenskii]|uniref:Cytochrome P450 4C1-like n=1 Tax=Bombus vosnesenskii TaxID=207650 RepID=A0A6J3JZW5_9HYME|nr:cytochrome P450 4C1-like [Bombus vosnesenskii]
MIITILFSLFLFVSLHYIILHYGKYGRILNSLPGPPILPIIGNVHHALVSSSNLWIFMNKMSDQYYPIFKLWGFTAALVHTRHPDDFQILFGNTKFTQKGYMYKLLAPWFSTGLLTSSGRKWRIRRKILTPAFHSDMLNKFVDVFVKEGEYLVKSLKSEEGVVVNDLFHTISKHTLNMICETAMGISLNDEDEFQHKYLKAASDMEGVFAYKTARPWLFYDFFLKFDPKGWRQSELLKTLHGFTRKIIQERKEYHYQSNGRCSTDFNKNSSDDNDNVESNDVGIRKRRLALLDILIEAHRNNQIDDEGIREEVDTFMFAGHDTTAIAVCYIIMLLAEHKEVQDRVRAEVKAVLKENEGKLNMSTLQDLSYLERCIKESLRLYPSVPRIGRKTEKELKLGNCKLPSSTEVLVDIYNIHRDPRYWPNPDIFDPDRFLPENSKSRHPYVYVPFGAGSRNCIGKRFAMLELKIIMSFLLNNYFFESVDYLKDISFLTGIIMKPAHRIRTKFIPIKDTC